MHRISPDLRTGLTFHRAGRYNRAESIYRAVLGEDPSNADALHLIGLILHQRGNSQAALDYVRNAVRIAPDKALYRSSLGEIERSCGNPSRAIEQFRRAIEIEPSFAEAHNNLGVTLRGLARNQEAVTHFGAAVATDPAYAEAHANLGTALLEDGETDAAVSSCERAVRLAPENVACLTALGGALLAAGRPRDAEAAYRLALDVAPDHGAALANRGIALHKLGRSEESMTCLLAALQRDPGRAEAHNSLGAVLLDRGDLDGAIARYRRALDLAPEATDWYRNLGAALLARGRTRDAVKILRQAIARGDQTPLAHVELGSALVRTGRATEAIGCFERALERDPDCDAAYINLVANLSQIAGWQRQTDLMKDLPSRLDRIEAGPARAASIMPLAFTLPYFNDDPASHRRALVQCARHVADRATQIAATNNTAPAAVATSGGRRLKIGYLSPDFGDHPIGHVTLPVYGLHDRKHFEIHCYSLQDRRSESNAYHETIRQSADGFADLSWMSHPEAADRIRADGIQILVDLTGYLPQGRPELFALRPAPVQVYWLGHGGGLGARYMDYVIGDPVVTPPEDDAFYVESIARLPDTFSSAPRAPISAQPLSRADFGLPDDAVVYCAFNNALKIEAETFEAWLAILSAVPGSVLWLTGSPEPSFRAALDTAARAAGIDPGRLIFAGRIDDKAVHLARHRLADLFLDTFKFNASTTALDALWAGLPILTRAGRSFHSRIGASYLSALGLDSLICRDTPGYVARAIDLGKDSEARARLHGALEQARTTMPLFDEARFVRHLESAYRRMWWQHTSGAAPVSFDAPLVVPTLAAGA